MFLTIGWLMTTQCHVGVEFFNKCCRTHQNIYHFQTKSGTGSAPRGGLARKGPLPHQPDHPLARRCGSVPPPQSLQYFRQVYLYRCNELLRRSDAVTTIARWLQSLQQSADLNPLHHSHKEIINLTGLSLIKQAARLSFLQRSHYGRPTHRETESIEGIFTG